MKKRVKADLGSKALRGANRRQLAEAQRAIRGFFDTYELEYWYCYDGSRVFYSYFYRGDDLYRFDSVICPN